MPQIKITERCLQKIHSERARATATSPLNQKLKLLTWDSPSLMIATGFKPLS